MPGAGGCGSCSGHKVPGEGEDGRTEDGQGRSDAEMNRIRKQTAKAIQDAVEQGQGNIPAGWKTWAEQELTPPQVRWQDQVARIVRWAYAYVAGMIDYRYDRPSRRQACFGYGAGSPVMPRMVKPKPEVMFVADTSGSMTGRTTMRVVASETQGVLQAIGEGMTFGACDAAMQTMKRVQSIEDCLQNWKGGGGTSFVPIFEAVKKMRRKPQLLIIATDSFGDAPAQPVPGVETLWLIIDPKDKKPKPRGPDGQPIQWGTFLFINPNQQQQAA